MTRIDGVGIAPASHRHRTGIAPASHQHRTGIAPAPVVILLMVRVGVDVSTTGEPSALRAENCATRALAIERRWLSSGAGYRAALAIERRWLSSGAGYRAALAVERRWLSSGPFLPSKPSSILASAHGTTGGPGHMAS